MPRAGIWARAIRVMSHMCYFTRYFHTGRLTAQTQFFRNLSDRHPLGREGRRNGRPLSGGKRTFCGIMSAFPPKADIREGAAKCLLMTQSGHSNPSLKTPVRVDQDGGGAVDGHIVGAQFESPTQCLRSTFLSSD